MQAKNKINHAAHTAAGALTMILVATTLPLTAHAQQNHQTSKNGAASITESTGAASSYVLASANLPGSVTPIMQRAATLMSAAQTRARTAPDGARQSYQSAIAAFQQLMAAGRFSAGNAMNVGNATNIPVSSTQVADDIRLLRSTAMSASGNQAAVLNRAASLYATGAKEFFIGELRDALLGDQQASRMVSSGRATTGRVSSAERARRANTNVQGGVIEPDGSIAAGATGSQRSPVTANGSGLNPVGIPVGGITAPVTGGAVVLPNTPVDPTAPIVPVSPVVVGPVVTTPVAPPVNPAPPPPAANP